MDPAIYSLSYLAVLHALVVPSIPSSVPLEFILEKLVIFMMKFDGRQCRLAGSLLRNIMEAVGSGRLLPVRESHIHTCSTANPLNSPR